MPLFLARKRVDSPTPILVAIVSSLARSTGPGMPSSSGMVTPRAAQAVDPVADPRRVEGQVADHVGRVAALVPHRLHGEVVVDRRVRLGVAGDADVGERRAQACEVLEQAERVGVVADRRSASPPGHEDPRDALAPSRLADLLELGAPGDHPRREVGHDGVPVAGEPLRQVEGRLEPLGRRGGDRDGHVPRDVSDHLLLGGRGRQHLVAGVRQQARQRRRGRLVAHGATRFVIRIECAHSSGSRGRRQTAPPGDTGTRAATPVG